MGIKYEAVFGDQGLFDRNYAPEDCEIIGDRCYKVICGEVNVWNFSEKRWCNHYKSSFLCLAMRRIIAEPKRWTVEDRKEGRLPEVGSLVMVEEVETKNNIFEFAGVCAGSKRFAVKDITDGFLYFYSKEMITPIETQEERAKREEDEFVDVIVSEYNNMPSSVSFKAGIRAAYRKLKGGE